MNAYEDEQLEIASNNSSNGKRRSALVALRNMRSTKGRPLFLALLRDDGNNQNLRETAIKALGETGNEEDIAYCTRSRWPRVTILPATQSPLRKLPT